MSPEDRKEWLQERYERISNLILAKAQNEVRLIGVTKGLGVEAIDSSVWTFSNFSLRNILEMFSSWWIRLFLIKTASSQTKLHFFEKDLQ